MIPPFLAGFAGKVILGLVGVGVLIGAYKYWEHKVGQIAELELAVEAAQEHAYALETQRQEDQLKMDELGGLMAKAQEERDAAVNTLNSYRQRLSVVAIKKPGLIAKKATKATNAARVEFCRITGGCDE
jgi:hypothetical protein